MLSLLLTLEEYSWWLPVYSGDAEFCFWGLEGWSALTAFAISILALFLLFLTNKNHKWFEGFASKHLTCFFVGVWLLCFMVYDIGMYTGNPWSIVGNAPMAVLHAFGTFILDSDVSAIHEPFHNNWLYMCAFSVAHFLAAFVSLMFVLKHFGYNIIAGLRLFYASSWLADNKKTTYVFWGMNDATYILAKSIEDHHQKENNNDYRIVVVRTNNDVDANSEKNGMERLFNFLSLKNSDLERLQDLACLTTSTYFNMAQLPNISEASVGYLNLMGLKRLEKLIGKKTTEKVHVFFLSEDETRNIQSVAILKNDTTLKAFAKIDDDVKNIETDRVTFYCHSRFNSINRVIEDLDVTNQINVRIIDSSHLSIECLKREEKYQPIRFVDIDATANLGTVKSKFTSLIVGFGTTGKDALRFLYEFGAFVDHRSKENVFRSPFICHVVDRNMYHVNGAIISVSPQMFENCNREEDGSEKLVNLYNMDYNTEEFYNSLLKQIAPDLNYIVIATGNDEEGMTLAVRILNYLRRQQRDFSKLRIFVRSYKPEQLPHLAKICKHYNEQEERIVIFGKQEDIFTYDMIVSNSLEERGKQYYDSYRALNPDLDSDGSWEQRRRRLKGLTTLEKQEPDELTNTATFKEEYLNPPKRPTVADLQNLRRKETQDKSNALHEATKLFILRKVCPSWFTTLLPKVLEDAYIGSIRYSKRKRVHEAQTNPKRILYKEMSASQQTLMDNLAMLEHLRWNASHEILGYSPMPNDVPDSKRGCNETLAWHNCLIPWEALDAESDKVSYIKDYKIFDYSVVETTMEIYRKNKEQQKKNH